MTETTLSETTRDERPDAALDPEAQLLQQHTVARVRAALQELPVDLSSGIWMRTWIANWTLPPTPPSAIMWTDARRAEDASSSARRWDG